MSYSPPESIPSTRFPGLEPLASGPANIKGHLPGCEELTVDKKESLKDDC